MSVFKNILYDIEGAWLSDGSASKTEGHLTVFIKFCAEYIVTEKLRQIIEIVRQRDEWTESLASDEFPPWFMKKFSKEISLVESNEWLARWRRLSGADQEAYEEALGWSFDSWIYWLHPQRRAWFIEDVKLIESNYYSLRIAVIDWPIPLKALIFLLHSLGATQIEVND